jgi:tRNA threonylcarbamoyladenosine biosynthesis protein TsaB
VTPTPSGLILAIETATPTARVAVLDRAGARRAAREATAERHSSNLLRLCDEALREAAVAPGALDAIACGAGPGSFTGLRIGLAAAKGLALPTERPFLLVSSLRALALDILGSRAAADAGEAALACACIDAGKGQVYAAFFRRAAGAALVEPVSDEWLLEPRDVASRAPAGGVLLVAGNGAARHADAIDAALAARAGARLAELPGPTADAIGRLAMLRLARGDADDLATAVPSYGRPPDITTPKR